MKREITEEILKCLDTVEQIVAKHLIKEGEWEYHGDLFTHSKMPI